VKPPGSRKGPAAKPGPSKSALPSVQTLPLEGLPEVDDAINPYFVGDAARVISEIVEAGGTVVADDLYKAGIGRPEKSNSVGSVFATLHRLGVIERVGFCGSRRAGRNSSAVGVWRAGAR
jgi:hypothetical protein